MSGYRSNISVDNLFPSDKNVSGTRGKKLDVATLFSGTALNADPEITFTSDILLEKIKKRRRIKLKYFRQMLKYCYKRIDDADDDQGQDIIFTVVEYIPECKDYDPKECLEYISLKLRSQGIDTKILTDTTMFITWKYLELKKEQEENEENDADSDKTRSDEDF